MGNAMKDEKIITIEIRRNSTPPKKFTAIGNDIFDIISQYLALNKTRPMLEKVQETKGRFDE